MTPPATCPFCFIAVTSRGGLERGRERERARASKCFIHPSSQFQILLETHGTICNLLRPLAPISHLLGFEWLSVMGNQKCPVLPREFVFYWRTLGNSSYDDPMPDEPLDAYALSGRAPPAHARDQPRSSEKTDDLREGDLLQPTTYRHGGAECQSLCLTPNCVSSLLHPPACRF